MFDYMTPLDYIELDAAAEPVSGTVEGAMAAVHAWHTRTAAPNRRARRPGHDTLSLTFNFLDALLYRFATEDFVCKDVRVHSIEGSGEGDALLLKYSAYVATPPPAHPGPQQPASPGPRPSLPQVGSTVRPAAPSARHGGQGHHLLQHAGLPEGAGLALLRHH